MKIPAQQVYLWERIEKRLNRLANRISPEDHRRIEAALIKKIYLWERIEKRLDRLA